MIESIEAFAVRTALGYLEKYACETKSMEARFLLSACSAVIIYKHMDNVRKIKAGEEMPIRKFLKDYIVGRN